jgi:hypothetical protein
MIVVTIIAIITVVALASVGNNRDERAVRSSTVILTDTFQELRTRSMMTARAIVVQVDRGNPETNVQAMVSWFESLDNACGNAPGTPTGTLPFVHASLSSRTQNVSITEIAPLTPGFDRSLRFCITPSGRFVDAISGLPFSRIAGSNYDGLARFELRSVRCPTLSCSRGGLFTVVQIDSSGLVEVLAPGSRVEPLVGGEPSDPGDP